MFATDFGMTVPVSAVPSEGSSYGAWGSIRLADGAVRIHPDPLPQGAGLVRGTGGWMVFREEFYRPPKDCRFVSEPDGCRGWVLLTRPVDSATFTVLARSAAPQDFTLAPLPVISGTTVAWTTVNPAASTITAPARVFCCTLPRCAPRSYPIANGMGFDYLPGDGLLWTQSPTRQGELMLRVALATGRSSEWLAPPGDADLTPGKRWMAFSRPEGQGVGVFIATASAAGLGPARQVASVPDDYGMHWLSPTLLVVTTYSGYTFVNVAAAPPQSVVWTADFDFGVGGASNGAELVLSVPQADGSEDLLVLAAGNA